MNINDYLLMFVDKEPCKIPSVRFWGITLLIVGAGIEIKMKDGHILTVEDCFIEMEDCASGDCYRIRKGGKVKDV